MKPISIPIPGNARTGVFSCLLAVVAAILLLYFGMNIHFQTDHARKHGDEPDRAEECLNNNGVTAAFQEKSGRIHLICAVTDEEFYDTVYKERGQLDGITSFQVSKYEWQRQTYHFDNIYQYIDHLKNVRGWTQLDPIQFQGPFQFIFP